MTSTRVASLSVRGFRNLTTQTVVFGARFNVLSGDNGAGKSSLLEAIDLVAQLSSFRGARADDLVTHGASDAVLEARVLGDDAPHVLRLQLARGKARQAQLDGKRPSGMPMWTHALQSVLFHPGDVDLATGPPEPRRALLDRVLSHIDPTYASALASYERALRSRNRLLRDAHGQRVDLRAIEAFGRVLAPAGALLGATRARLTEELGPVAERAFVEISGDELGLQVVYAPRVEPTEASLRAALGASLQKDLARGFTGEGPHADDLALRVRGLAARHRASQGQHRAMVLALKIAELQVLARRVGRTPVLLLDDVSSELDRVRSERFFGLLARLGGQVFITTTQPELVRLSDARTDFTVERGVVRVCAA